MQITDFSWHNWWQINTMINANIRYPVYADDCLWNIIEKSSNLQQIEPDMFVELEMLDGSIIKMRITAEKDCMSKYGYAAYWFAFDEHEDANEDSEFAFADKIKRWRFDKTHYS